MREILEVREYSDGVGLRDLHGLARFRVTKYFAKQTGKQVTVAWLRVLMVLAGARSLRDAAST